MWLTAERRKASRSSPHAFPMSPVSGTRGDHRFSRPAGSRRQIRRRRFFEQLFALLEPARELQNDTVRIHEIDRTNDRAFIHRFAHLARRSVMIDDSVRNTFGRQPLTIFVDLLRWNIKGNVV